MRAWTLALFLGIGCLPDIADDTSDTSVDPDTGTDPDTGIDTDAERIYAGKTSKPADVDRSGISLKIGLLRVTPEVDGWWTAGKLLIAGELDRGTAFELSLPLEPPADDIAYLPGDRQGALYLPFVFDDIDEDDLFVDNGNDLVAGYAESHWVFYQVNAPNGEPNGWSIVDVTRSKWTYYPLDHPADIHLFGLLADARIEGIYEGSRRNVGIMAVDERTLEGEGEGYPHWRAIDTIPHFDTRQFDVTVDQIPAFPARQFPDDKPSFVRAVLQLYDDENGDGAYTPGEDPLPGIGLCYYGRPLVVRYSDPPTSIRVARQLKQLGWQAGWRFVIGDYGQSTELTRRELAWYRYDNECPLGGE